MKSTVETLSPTRVRLAIEVPFAELEPSLKKAYREIGSQVTIPGFRQGKVPTAVIDQRVGRGHGAQRGGAGGHPGADPRRRPRARGARRSAGPRSRSPSSPTAQPLKFTAEVDVRPEITLPDLAGIEVTVDELEVGDERDRRAGRRAAGAVRHAEDRRAGRPSAGDFVQIDLAATVDGEEVPGGTRHQPLPRGRQQPAAAGPGRGAGRAWPPATATTFTTAAGRRRLRRPGRRGGGDRAHGQGASELPRAGRRVRPAGERVRHPRRAARPTCASGSAGSSGSSSSTPPGTRRSRRWSRPPRCRRRRASSRDEVESRKQAMADQLERIGASLEDYLAAEEQDRGGDRRRADRGGRPRASRSSCCWTRSPTPRTIAGLRRRVRPRDRAPGAARRDGPAAVLRPAGPGRRRRRRSSATCGAARRWPSVLERVTIKDTDRQRGHPRRRCAAEDEHRRPRPRATERPRRPPARRPAAPAAEPRVRTDGLR